MSISWICGIWNILIVAIIHRLVPAVDCDCRGPSIEAMLCLWLDRLTPCSEEIGKGYRSIPRDLSSIQLLYLCSIRGISWFLFIGFHWKCVWAITVSLFPDKFSSWNRIKIIETCSRFGEPSVAPLLCYMIKFKDKLEMRWPELVEDNWQKIT